MSTNDPYGPLIQSAAQQNGVDPFVLRGLLQSESSMNPGAVSKDKNGNPVAYGIAQFTPDTAKSIGLSNPMDPTQAIPAAAKLLRQNLDQTGGNVAQAIATYKAGTDQSGWGPVTVSGTKKAIDYADQARGQSAAAQDPVLGFMAQASKGAAQQPATGNPPAATDPTLAFMNGQQPAQQPAQPPQPSQPAQQSAPAAPSSKMQLAQQISGNPITDTLEQGALHLGSGIVGNIAGLGAGAYKLASTLDPSQAWQAYEGTAAKVGNAIDSINPNAQTQGGKVGTFIANIPGRIIGAGTNALADTVGSAASALGASPQTSQKISDLTKLGTAAGLTVAGGRLAKGRGDESAPAAPVEETPVAPVQPVEAAAPEAVPAESPQAPAQQPPTQPQAQPATAPPQPAQTSPSAAPAAGPAPVPAANLPAVSGKASDLFPSPDKAPTVAGTLPADEQAQRVAVVQALGLDRVRDSVISGDAKQSGIEYQNAKVDSPIGNVTRDTIAGEQNAIRNYADQINEMTGRDPSLDAEGSGQKILAPFQKMSDWFDNQAGQLYQQARDQAGDVPLRTTPALNALLGDADVQDRMGASTDGSSMLNAVRSRYARFVNLGERTPTAETGGLYSAGGAPEAGAPRSVENAENFRQWLNQVGRDNPRQQWFVSQVKQALDEDVASSGGAGLFNQARSMWQQRQQMLSDPAKLGKLLADPNGTGLNRTVAPEKVGQTVVNMDGSNFRNVLDSLTKIQKMAPELAPDVEGALAEIRGHAARQLTDAGGKTEYWNANQFSKAAQTMAPKLKLLFNNDEMGALRTLNEAGRIIRQPGAYPGAAAQHLNMFHSGIATGLPYAASAAGHFIGGPVGAVVGQMAGTKLSSLAKKGGESAAAAKLAKRYSKNVSP